MKLKAQCSTEAVRCELNLNIILKNIKMLYILYCFDFFNREFDSRSNGASEKGHWVVLALRTSEEHMQGNRPLWPRQPNKPL